MADLRQNIGLKIKQVEAMLCAGALNDYDTVMNKAGWLSHDSFYDKTYAEYWRRISDGESPPKVAENLGILTELLGEITNVSFLQYEDYANMVSESAYLRGTYDKVSGVIKAISDSDVAGVERLVGEISMKSIGGTKTVYTPEEIDEKFRNIIANPRPAIYTGLGGIDKYGGLFPQELTVLAARPGMGKTALCTQIARSVAYGGKKALFVSLEMSKEQLWARMACGNAGAQWKDVRSGNVKKEMLEKVNKESEKLATALGGNLLIQDEVSTLQEISRVCVQVMPDLVVIDQLPDIVWHDPSESEVSWYGKACKYIRQNVARRLNVPVILIHQLSRKVEERTDKRPILSDLRWSGEVEQRADVVLMCYRDDYYHGRLPDENNVVFELWIRKNRQGVQDACVFLTYDLSAQWFTTDVDASKIDF
jgi:replicative DNA helicase